MGYDRIDNIFSRNQRFHPSFIYQLNSGANERFLKITKAEELLFEMNETAPDRLNDCVGAVMNV
jgi:hypothetical protein